MFRNYSLVLFLTVFAITMLYMMSIMMLQDTRTTYLPTSNVVVSDMSDYVDDNVMSTEYTNAERLITAITKAQLYGKTTEESISIVRSIVRAIYKEANLTVNMENDIMKIIRSIVPVTNHVIIDACIDIIETQSDIDKSAVFNKLIDICVQHSN